MEVQAHNSLELPLEIKSGPDPFDESRFVMTFLTILSYRNIMQFQINSRKESK